MTIEISCPDCGEEYRVRDEAAGKAFKCKSCGTTVRIPDVEVLDDDEDDDEPPARRRSSRDDDDDDRPRKRKRRSSGGNKTLGPAIGLYVVGGLWLAYCAVSGIIQMTNPNLVGAQPPPGADQAYIIGHRIGFYGVIIGYPIITSVILFGAFCLQTRRLYAMAMIACILASIPCCSPGCILGMPFGIWGLVVMNQDDVKRSFG